LAPSLGASYPWRVHATKLLYALALSSAGCGPFEPGHDSKTPGDLLGTYAISGSIKKDDCGAELLGAPDPWQFEVKLSRLGHQLYWLNGREAIVGDIASDGVSFQFDTRVDVPIGGQAAKASRCVVSRRDRAQGALLQDDEQVLGLTGDLAFEYSSKSDLECLEIIGIPGSVQALPCSLAYSITGDLTAP
jgi:hypothetical protein